MQHRYRLTNSTRQDVRILDVINRRACCGIVRAAREILRSGDTLYIEVTLLVGDRFGQVAHEAEVITEPPSEPSLVLQTIAEAVPPVRVEELSTSQRTILIGSKEPEQAGFRVYACGTSSEPPVDLNRLELSSSIEIAWEGPKQPIPSDGDLRVESRRLIVTMDSAGPPGDRRAEILFRQGETILSRHPVSWEVASPITVSPRVIAIRAGQREYRVVIRSRDRQPFRVTRVQCRVPGVRGRISASTAALTQTVQLEGYPQSKDRHGAMTIFTDHPGQQNVDVPFVFID